MTRQHRRVVRERAAVHVSLLCQHPRLHARTEVERAAAQPSSLSVSRQSSRCCRRTLGLDPELRRQRAGAQACCSRRRPCRAAAAAPPTPHTSTCVTRYVAEVPAAAQGGARSHAGKWSPLTYLRGNAHHPPRAPGWSVFNSLPQQCMRTSARTFERMRFTRIKAEDHRKKSGGTIRVPSTAHARGKRTLASALTH